ncbi:FAD-binding oxidoreductase [Jiangella alkaliphila]|uniref:FAD/FMN-containing dehydrogenase n=1 Tax=Jiangella alkaliphila TaxID=419479 RepID=A0A1H2GW07_9ACTN|nr:FAD-binding oxidoreductase [Jiangella alkaliphila]SDU23458.1 FAD/FMN-containing dehydrogenase [Jiangella alkaliphila]
MTITIQHQQTTAATVLRGAIAGDVHEPGDAGYDQHRKPLLPTLDPRPDVVVEARSTADAQAAVRAAREHGLPFSVQATGHGTYVPNNGGLLLKTTAMSSVFVDPIRQVARVRPGTLWGDVLAATRPYGLAPLSGSSPTVGVTGYTLGGGMGWLARKHGFAADSVLSADIVTADGRLLTVSPDRHPDLFWAIRGGGGGFGVVTSLEFRVYPVAQVYGGISWFDVSRAADALRVYRDWAAAAPDEMSSAVVLTKIPDVEAMPAELRGRRALGIKALYTGRADDAERLLRPLRLAAGPALVDGYRSMDYADAAMGGTPARFFDFFPALGDDVVDTVVEAAEAGSAVEIRNYGGATARPGPGAGPVSHRGVPFSVILDTPTPEFVDRLRPHGIGGAFLNFLADTTRTSAAYTPADYARLCSVKAAYDPDGFFAQGHAALGRN